MEQLLPFIIQAISGLVGGNIAGLLAKAKSLGPILNSILGAAGGIGAAQGAQAALVSAEARARLNKLQQAMEYKELSGLPEFNDAYMEAMMFPEED